MNRTKFKKGDELYIVSISHGQSGGWDHTSEAFRTRVGAELVVLTSLGKKQGTALTKGANLERRIYTGSTVLVATKEEVEAIRASIGTEQAEKTIQAAHVNALEWKRNYADTGRGTALGIQRNELSLQTIAACVPLEHVIIWR